MRCDTSAMRAFCIASCVMLSVFVCPSVGTSIDQMIWEASETVEQFDKIADLNGDTVFVEMDMMLTIDQYLNLYADEKDEKSRFKRKAIKRSSYRWKNNVIPYNLDYRGSFTSRDRGEIMKAIAEWEQYTCLDFRPKTSQDTNYVNFDNGNGCYSYVGMTGGSQKIGLARGCRYKGVVVHEIGHAVGFHHEQNRPDRDDHVTILFQNIPQTVRYNFKKYPYSAVDTFGVPYDYSSIMHYGGKAFSTNNQYTIKTKKPEMQGVIGNRKGLSFNDIKLANLMYKCSSRCSSSTKCPSYAFLSKDCKCMCPGSPIKECGGSTSKPVVTSRPRVTTTPKVTTCEDGHHSCPAWAKSPKNYCYTNTYVKNYCKKSCNKCSGGETKVETCFDVKKDSCPHWKNRGYCTKTYVEYMRENCAKTCGVCEVRRVGDGDASGQLGDGGAGGNTGTSLAGNVLVAMATLPVVLSARLLQ